MSWLKTTAKSTGKRALERAISGLNRADEIGGEIRDFVQDRVLRDERYVRVRKRIDQIRGKVYTSRSEAEMEAASQAAAVARAAPPPAASVPVAQKGLGNADIPAQIYGKSSCPWSGRAIRLLEDLKVDYDFIDLDDADNGKLEGKLVAETSQKTTPWIYLRGQFQGGYDALSEIHRVGQLEYLLLSEEEKKHANPALRNVVVAPRPDAGAAGTE